MSSKPLTTAISSTLSLHYRAQNWTQGSWIQLQSRITTCALQITFPTVQPGVCPFWNASSKHGVWPTLIPIPALSCTAWAFIPSLSSWHSPFLQAQSFDLTALAAIFHSFFTSSRWVWTLVLSSEVLIAPPCKACPRHLKNILSPPSSTMLIKWMNARASLLQTLRGPWALTATLHP